MPRPPLPPGPPGSGPPVNAIDTIKSAFNASVERIVMNPKSSVQGALSASLGLGAVLMVDTNHVIVSQHVASVVTVLSAMGKLLLGLFEKDAK